MTVYDLIYKKRNGGTLTDEEIALLITRYCDGELPDYQMSAFLMAAAIRGLDGGETAALAAAMTNSGRVLDLSKIPGVKADKHSTGGVGDGTSMVVAPLAASCGLVVPMMSGRCLGHTGGTLDKLESIPGFVACLPEERVKEQLARIGVALIGQTPEIAPADRKMYALRDVTATVDSIPLIAASIMSKKIAEGTEVLVLDVKTGSGAFMRTIEDARLLARTMIGIGKRAGMRVSALITDMDQPLGGAVGNAVEVRQAVEVLKGGGPEDFRELSLALAARMLVLAGLERGEADARRCLEEKIKTGAALEKFRRIVEAQGGDARVVDDPDKVLPRAAHGAEVTAPRAGYVTAIDAGALGRAAILLRAGRTKKEDAIDPAAGLILRKKRGEYVEKDEPVVSVLHNDGADEGDARRMVREAYTIGEASPEAIPLIYEELHQ